MNQLINEIDEIALIDKINVYYPSLNNSMYQYCNDNSFTIGGSTSKGNGSAIHISNYLRQGMCFANSETFEQHPQLSKRSHYKIKRFEVWGFS